MKKFFLVFLCCFMFGCATRINHPAASLSDQEKINFAQVEGGQARVHFYMGEAEMYGGLIPINQAMEILINNKSIGIIGNKDEFICVDLYPGEYSFTWRSIGATDRAYEVPIPLVLIINEKDLVFLSADSSLTNPSILGGGLLSAATMKLYPVLNRVYTIGRQKVSQKRLVLRNSTIKDSLSSLKSD